jgi:hypothetical protein
MAKKFQITFVWPDDDWTWINVEANDFHQAMLIALDKCPTLARVKNIEREPEGKTFGPIDESVKQSI